MDKMLHRPIAVAPTTETLEDADTCIVGALQGELRPGCERIEVSPGTNTSDGRRRVVIEMSPKNAGSRK